VKDALRAPRLNRVQLEKVLVEWGIAQQQAIIKAHMEKEKAEKERAILSAEAEKEKAILSAEAEKEKAILSAEREKEKAILFEEKAILFEEKASLYGEKVNLFAELQTRNAEYLRLKCAFNLRGALGKLHQTICRWSLILNARSTEKLPLKYGLVQKSYKKVL